MTWTINNKNIFFNKLTYSVFFVEICFFWQVQFNVLKDVYFRRLMHVLYIYNASVTRTSQVNVPFTRIYMYMYMYGHWTLCGLVYVTGPNDSPFSKNTESSVIGYQTRLHDDRCIGNV